MEFQDPVFNCCTCSLAERFFCEGLYDELPNLKLVLSSEGEKRWLLDWVDDFKIDIINGNFDKSKYDKIVFDENSFKKLRYFFKKFDDKTKFLTDKILENLSIYEKENCYNSNFYYYGGEFLISCIVQYENIELFNYLSDKEEIFEFCEIWENILENGPAFAIKLAMSNQNFMDKFEKK